MNLFLRIFWRVVIYGALFMGGLSLFTFLTYIRPQRHITGITPAGLNMPYEDITLLTEDNISLAGWFIPAKNDGNKAIVVCHGYPADKGDVLSLATFLHEKFHLLFFDFRAMGKSGGRITSCGWKEQKDFLAAVAYLKSRGIDRIGALGFSMGGAVIIMANSPDVDAIVTESAYANLQSLLHVIYRNFGIFRYPLIYATRLWSRIFFGIDLARIAPKDYIKSVKAPILLIHSELDSQIPVEHAHALKKAKPETKLWVVDRADHGSARALQQVEYERRILDFFSIL